MRAGPEGRAGRLGGDRDGRLPQLVAVGERLGEAAGGVGAQGRCEAGQVEGGAEVADGGVRGGEEGGAAFVEHFGVRLGRRRFLQGPFEAAPGGVGGADGEVLAGGGAQLRHDVGVVVRVHLQEVAGGGGRAEARVGDRPGGRAVQGGADGGRDGPVHGGGDQRVGELQGSVPVRTRASRSLRAQSPASSRPMPARRAARSEGDAGAEDGGGPGEPGGAVAEFLQSVGQAVAAGGGAQVAQSAGAAGDGVEPAVPHLREEFDGLVRVAAGDCPQLAAERRVGALAESGADQVGGGLLGERAEGDGEPGLVAEAAQQRRGGFGTGVGAVPGAGTGTGVGAGVGAVGEDDEQRQGGQSAGEGSEPGERLRVGPVGVVDEDHEGLAALLLREPGDDPVQSVPYALGVGERPGRRGEGEGGSGEVEAVAEEAPQAVLGFGEQGGEEELAHEVEGHGGHGLGARAGQDGAAPAGAAPYLGEEGGLADAGLAPVDEQSSGGRGAAQRVDGAYGRGEFRFPLQQGYGERVFRRGRQHRPFPSMCGLGMACRAGRRGRPEVVILCVGSVVVRPGEGYRSGRSRTIRGTGDNGRMDGLDGLDGGSRGPRDRDEEGRARSARPRDGLRAAPAVRRGRGGAAAGRRAAHARGDPAGARSGSWTRGCRSTRTRCWRTPGRRAATRSGPARSSCGGAWPSWRWG